jgi:uncharacterized protein (DUF488 family)
MNKLYTFGYIGMKMDAIHRKMDEIGAVIADVRLRPYSRAAVWNKGSFVKEFGPDYVHVPELGNRNYKGGDIVIHDPEAGASRILALLEEHPVALMCVCKEYLKCHRRTAARLVCEAGKRDYDRVVHLDGADILQGESRGSGTKAESSTGGLRMSIPRLNFELDL